MVLVSPNDIPATVPTNVARTTQSCAIMAALPNIEQAAPPALQSGAIIAASLQNPDHAAALKALNSQSTAGNLLFL